MQNRLYNRYVKLKARGKTETKIIVAIARELSAFLWELQNKLNLPLPGPAPIAPIAPIGSHSSTTHRAAAPDPAVIGQARRGIARLHQTASSALPAPTWSGSSS